MNIKNTRTRVKYEALTIQKIKKKLKRFVNTVLSYICDERSANFTNFVGILKQI